MEIHINGKQIDVGESLRSYVRNRLMQGVKKYFDRPIDGHVTLSREGGRFRTDCSVHVGHGLTMQSHGEAPEAYASFDLAADRLEKRLRRYKRRLRGRHNGQSASVDLRPAQSYVLAAGEEDGEEPAELQPVIIAETSTEIPSVSVGEAVMRMDLADVPVVLFRNHVHGELNVVYRRADGNIGWIDPAPAGAQGGPTSED
jgi:ribosomal subunit interface protein